MTGGRNKSKGKEGNPVMKKEERLQYYTKEIYKRREEYQRKLGKERDDSVLVGQCSKRKKEKGNKGRIKRKC